MGCLWPPALEWLAALGVGAELHRHGATVDHVAVEGRDTRDGDPAVLSRTTAPEDAPPTLVRTRTLRRVLAEQIPGRLRQPARSVASLSREDGGLVVEFDDDIEEWFDVVVGADGWNSSLPRGSDTPVDRTLTHYEVPIERGGTAPTRIRERWRPDALVRWTPRPSGAGGLLQVTVPDHESSATLVDHLDGALAAGATGVDSDLATVEPRTVHQAASPAASPARWGVDRVSFCGAAAYPVTPASGFRHSFGIEDAVAFVSELVRGSRSATVVETYAARRARRVTALHRRAAATRTRHGYPIPTPGSSPLAAVGLRRSVALGPFLGSTLAALQRDGCQ